MFIHNILMHDASKNHWMVSFVLFGLIIPRYGDDVNYHVQAKRGRCLEASCIGEAIYDRCQHVPGVTHLCRDHHLYHQRGYSVDLLCFHCLDFLAWFYGIPRVPPSYQPSHVALTMGRLLCSSSSTCIANVCKSVNHLSHYDKRVFPW